MSVEKKRKGAMSVPAPTPPAKRSKKSVLSEPIGATKPKLEEFTTKPSDASSAVSKPKTGRKRAVDFLGDDDEISTTAAALPAATATPPKKAKKNAATADKSTNGANTNQNSETVDLTSEDGSADEGGDQGAALLAGFDSDGEDLAEDQGDMSRTQPIPQFKKTSKKLRQAKEKGSDGPGTVYVGRIPHGFYETQMRDYFSQFGEITQLRLSRNKRTGASKHFAFIEFESDEVAKIVAETMDNYLMFGHILKCKYAPSENLHPDLWKGANRKYRRIPHDKIEKQRLEAPKTQDQWAKKNEKERQKRMKQVERMKAIGYEYVTPKLTDPSDVLDQRKEQEHNIPAAITTSSEQPNAIAAAPFVSAQVEEGSTKKAKKTKKARAEGSEQLLTKGNLDARNAGPVAESAKIAQNLEDKKNKIATVDTVRDPVAAPRKSKKAKTESSGLEGSSHGDYDTLSSIPVGSEAAPASVTDAVVPAEPESISTHAGIADAVLAGRKSDRKKARPERKRHSTEEMVSSIAPGAVRRDKKEKERLKARKRKD